MGTSDATAQDRVSRRVPQQERSRRTRARIIEAAVECFDRTGFDDTTTVHIAQAAGVGVGTLYGYFDNKRDILLEIVDGIVAPVAEFLVEELASERTEDRPPAAVIESLTSEMFKSQALRPGLQQVLWQQYFRDPELQARLVVVRDRARQAIEDFARGHEGGLLRPDLDLETASFVVLHAVQWNATQSMMHLDAGRTAAVAAATAQMISHYLFGSTGPDGELQAPSEATRPRTVPPPT